MKRDSLPSLAIATAALWLFAAGPAAAEADAARGEQLFKRCAACHSLEPGTAKIGPSLAGIFGRSAGTVEGFRYSEAMKAADVVWSAETLDSYLADPKGFIPGNRMPFPGLKNAGERAALIEYLARETGAR